MILVFHVPRIFLGLSFTVCDRPGIKLLDLIKGATHAILIDALQGSVKKNVVERLELEDVLQTASAISSHNIGVADTLALGQALGTLPPTLWLYGIQTSDSVTNNPHSEIGNDDIHTATQRIEADLLKIFKNKSMV